MIRIFKGNINRENFEISLFRKVVGKLFALRKQYKDEHNDLLQGLVQLMMNNLYGVQIREDINECYKCKSGHWMQTEYDEMY